MTVLPERLRPALRTHLDRVRAVHERDLRDGAGSVELPGALSRKLPGADREWGWQWVFPASRRYWDRGTGERRRHHIHPSVLQRLVRRVGREVGMLKRRRSIPCGTHSPRTSWRRGTTFGRCRSCWAIGM